MEELKTKIESRIGFGIYATMLMTVGMNNMEKERSAKSQNAQTDNHIVNVPAV